MAEVPPRIVADSGPEPAAPVWTPDRMLARLAGDRELARELAAIFVAECPRMLQALREGIEEGQADAVRRAAHAFKGSVLNFADDGAATAAFELENCGRDNELADAPAVFARLERDAASLVEHLQAFQKAG